MISPKPSMCGIPYHSRKSSAVAHSDLVLPFAIGFPSFLISYAPQLSNCFVGVLSFEVYSTFQNLFIHEAQTLRYPFLALKFALVWSSIKFLAILVYWYYFSMRWLIVVKYAFVASALIVNLIAVDLQATHWKSVSSAKSPWHVDGKNELNLF
jgi:hypothetical protein